MSGCSNCWQEKVEQVDVARKLTIVAEVARDYLRERGRFVSGGFVSPAADAYHKPNMVSAFHRLNMVRLALADMDWVALDEWEATHPRFVRTYEVMLRLKRETEQLGWGLVDVYLVCGADLVECIADEKKWPVESIQQLFKVGYVMWMKRDGKGGEVLEKDGKLERYAERCLEMQGCVWSMSSTVVR